MSACSLSTTVNEMISKFFLFRRFYQFASTLFADPKLGSWGDNTNSFKIRYQRERGSRYVLFLLLYIKIMISIIVFFYYS